MTNPEGTVNHLLRIIETEDPNHWSEEWVNAVDALSKINDPRIVEPLCRYLKVRDHNWAAPSKRMRVVRALADIADARAAEPLCQALQDLPGDDGPLADNISMALNKIGEPAVDSLLKAIKSGRDWRGRWHAAYILKEIIFDERSPELEARILPVLKPRLRPIIGERDNRVREVVIGIISDIDRRTPC